MYGPSNLKSSTFTQTFHSKPNISQNACFFLSFPKIWFKNQNYVLGISLRDNLKIKICVITIILKLMRQGDTLSH